ncbi:outer membrane lipid asymmetry maintenance protein MlaD [Thiobacillus sp.]|uniref:outer membrane lipid asymmetry maintenance protein MlaD n=1 Tax=Thiobacillus sp. TaxID=924 RepID=UPI00286E13B8|nr:outer membrane lipid asymmetry maintenance protein MlaD [Thiobacillus sp.]
MNKTKLDLWVGLFVAAGIVALLFLALKVGSTSALNSAEGYEVIARFENIGGLKPRAPVKVAGVVVGRVADIQFDDDNYEAVVTLRLDKRYVFPKDSSAAILTSGLLGEQYVGLEAGGDSVKLKEKDRILITQDAVVLENLIGRFLYDKAQEGAPQ